MYRVPFINRLVELSILSREYNRDEFSLIIVYGRRRIGKTRLLWEWCKDKECVYFIASQIPYRELSREFSSEVMKQLKVYVSSDDIVSSIRDLADLGKKVIIVLDEFQYIAETDPSFPSRLMKLIDTMLVNSKLKLVLCGSSVSFFEKQLLGYRSPLFGRRTSTIKLRFLRLVEANDFLKKLDPVDKMRVYSIVGGTPAYLSYIYGSTSLREAIYRVVSPGSLLLDEAYNLLRQEVREPKTYMSILYALANGYNTSTEISRVTGVDPRNIDKYILVLSEMDIVEKRKPLGFRKGARIFFRDPYFLFWFKYIHKLRRQIELGYTDDVVNYLLERIDEHVSHIFTGFIEDHIIELNKLGLIEARPVEHGPWWYKGYEIDLVIREPGKITVFLEAKWSRGKLVDALRVLKSLEKKARHTGLHSPLNKYVAFYKEITDLDGPFYNMDENRVVIDYTKIYNNIYRMAVKNRKHRFSDNS